MNDRAKLIGQFYFSRMLSDERIHQITVEAAARAKAITDDALRKEAANLHVEHNDAPDGDDRTELGIMARVYTEEMIRRGLTAK